MKLLSHAASGSSFASYPGIVRTATSGGVPWQSHPEIVPAAKLQLKKPTQNEIFPEEFAQLTCKKHLDHEHCNTSMLVGSNFNDVAWQTHKSLNISEEVCS